MMNTVYLIVILCNNGLILAVLAGLATHAVNHPEMFDGKTRDGGGATFVATLLSLIEVGAFWGLFISKQELVWIPVLVTAVHVVTLVRHISKAGQPLKPFSKLKYMYEAMMAIITIVLAVALFAT